MPTRIDTPVEIVPLTQAEAKRFISHHHRHNLPSVGAVFVIGLSKDSILVGAAMAGRPVSRLLNDGKTLEVTRVAVDGTRNANSMLYGACARAAKALGYKRMVTYTLTTESGCSLKASGWQRDAEERSHNPNWARPSRASSHGPVDLFGERMPTGPKIRWWKHL